MKNWLPGNVDIPGQGNALGHSYCPGINAQTDKGHQGEANSHTSVAHLPWRVLPDRLAAVQTWTWVEDVSEHSSKAPRLEFSISLVGSLEGIRK